MSENRPFDPEDFISADASPAAHSDEEEPRGSIAGGIVGALLGALVGVIPWFLASTYTSFFIGWLGFLVGVAACFGYKLLHGRRSARFATATVIVCSMLAIFAAEVASWMVILCTDPEWQADAAWYGISVVRLAWESILMPENWGVMAPSMLMGMGIGILGVLSVRPKVLAYAGSTRAAQPALSPAAQMADANESVASPVPERFTVRDGKGTRLLLRVCGVVSMLFFALMFIGILADAAESPDDWALGETIGFLLFALAMIALGLFLVMHARRRIVVEGDVLSYLPTFGGARTFRCGELAGMRLKGNGRELVGRDGKTLARFEDNQQGAALLLQYLRKHGVGLL